MGPILFLFYISRLFSVISKHLPDCHGFPDDSQLYLSFRPLTFQVQEAAVGAVTTCIADVRSWYITNELMINDTKTEFMVIGSRQQLQKVNIDSIRVGDTDIRPVTSVRNLGVWFDATMSMETHVSKVCSKAFFGLYKIRQIRKFLSPDVTRTLVHAFVTSHLDYCNAVLYGVPEKTLARLQRVLNSAARVVTLVPRFDHITPVLIQLHWLPVRYRIQFKVLLLVFKAIKGLAPQYVIDMVRPRRSGARVLRSDSHVTLVVPKTNCKTFGDRAFAASGPRLWNQLPSSIREAGSIPEFKGLLKLYLFGVAFEQRL